MSVVTVLAILVSLSPVYCDFRLVNFDISPTSASNLPDGNVILWNGLTKGTHGQILSSKTTNYQIIRTDGRDVNNGLAKQMNLGEMFCTGTSNLPNGNVLINGGSNTDSTILFHYKSSSFAKTHSMNRPRGYNANCVTTDNRVFTLGGEWGEGLYNGINFYGEIMTLNRNGSYVWEPLVNVSGSIAGTVESPNADQSNQNHMWLFAFKGNNNRNYVFKAGPTPNMHLIDVNYGTMKFVGKRGNDNMGIQGIAVQFAPGKILTLSGCIYQDGDVPGSKDAYVIDINPMVNNGIHKITGPITRSFRRTTHNAVILPGGNVLVMGGQTQLAKWSDMYSVLQPEMYDPLTNKFTVINSTVKYARNYHSVALLLKDGRVLLAGSGSGACETPTDGCPTRFNGEIFTPPYLKGIAETKRPKIISATNFGKKKCSNMDLSYQHCKVFEITMDVNSCGVNGATGCSFELIRLSSVTHSVNNDQLRIPLVSNAIPNTIPNATPNSTKNRVLVSISQSSLPFTISGYYHLFAINKETKVPSVAVIIQVKRN
jgi:hypothetical protein